MIQSGYEFAYSFNLQQALASEFTVHPQTFFSKQVARPVRAIAKRLRLILNLKSKYLIPFFYKIAIILHISNFPLILVIMVVEIRALESGGFSGEPIAKSARCIIR